MNKENLKTNMKKVLPAFLLCGVVGLGALAWLVDTDITDNKGNISAGQLSVEFINEASAYNNLNAMPTSRETALAGTPYSFTVKNNGTVDEIVRLSSTNLNHVDGGNFVTNPYLVNVVIQTEAGETIYDGKLSDFLEMEEVGNGETLYPKMVDGVLTDEFYTEAEIEGLTPGVDYSTNAVEAIKTISVARSEAIKLASGAEINLVMYSWIDETATPQDLYVDGEATSIQYGLKAFAIQEQDTFVDETDGNSYEMQWDSLVDANEVVFDEIFPN